ncbi:MAG TPA: arsenic metallochaperone ArsD family protein [Methanocorpusculum sp.]|nr:arsenic metallochaperone ArsD family protein [Methanocorpusculum sp.]HJJ40240.1 arsenic metallochaperone ArsD family protein [Methanocorpusculum sp.]HJJ49629.1 arsenic metallochaperone ArsD family protein [Methanocorpusculum sp.]HJJ57773.1 arsenic metallochaperone ArsD family protein [Methanocorpusculum sp.]
MANILIVEDTIPDSLSPDYLRIIEVTGKLEDAGFSLPRIAVDKCVAPAVLDLVNKNGMSILPITLVNGFPMYLSRYPSNDEIKQILNVPDGILEKKICGCCCIEGCGGDC